MNNLRMRKNFEPFKRSASDYGQEETHSDVSYRQRASYHLFRWLHEPTETMALDRRPVRVSSSAVQRSCQWDVPLRLGVRRFLGIDRTSRGQRYCSWGVTDREESILERSALQIAVNLQLLQRIGLAAGS